MIRNIVFDFGQVLIKFDPDILLSPDFSDPADRALAEPILLDRALWARLDTGEVDEEDILAEMLPRLPERLHEPAARVMRAWHDRLPPVDGMWDLVRRVKKDYGVRVYLLSNISRTFPDHLENYPVLSEMDGCVFSGKIGLVKPSPAIFAYLCDTYGLSPAESLFVDDNEDNINAARAFGLNAYLFDGDTAALSDYIDGLFQ